MDDNDVKHKTTTTENCFEVPVIDCMLHGVTTAWQLHCANDGMIYVPVWLHDRKWDGLIAGHLALSALAASL